MPHRQFMTPATYFRRLSEKNVDQPRNQGSEQGIPIFADINRRHRQRAQRETVSAGCQNNAPKQKEDTRRAKFGRCLFSNLSCRLAARSPNDLQCEKIELAPVWTGRKSMAFWMPFSEPKISGALEKARNRGTHLPVRLSS
jgi:hypothetical protein